MSPWTKSCPLATLWQKFQEFVVNVEDSFELFSSKKFCSTFSRTSNTRRRTKLSKAPSSIFKIKQDINFNFKSSYFNEGLNFLDLLCYICFVFLTKRQVTNEIILEKLSSIKVTRAHELKFNYKYFHFYKPELTIAINFKGCQKCRLN